VKWWMRIWGTILKKTHEYKCSFHFNLTSRQMWSTHLSCAFSSEWCLKIWLPKRNCSQSYR
jgi:hypothetical protein